MKPETLRLGLRGRGHLLRVLEGMALCAMVSARAYAQQVSSSPSLHPAEDPWIAVAHRVPGFAGHWFEGSTLVLVLVDTTRVSDALREVADEVAPRTYSAVRVQLARFDFVQLDEWRDLVFDHLDTIGWTTLGISQEQNLIGLTVRDSSRLAPARQALLALGIPPAAFELEVGSMEIEGLTPIEPRPRDRPAPVKTSK